MGTSSSETVSVSDNDVGWTPDPGSVVPPGEAISIIENFIKSFRVDDLSRHPSTPTWCLLPSSARRTTLSALRQLKSAIASNKQVYFYFEGGRELRLTTVDEVSKFIHALQPWEGWDMYLFDATMKWCLAFTHRQMNNEMLVFQVGDLPTIRP